MGLKNTGVLSLPSCCPVQTHHPLNKFYVKALVLNALHEALVYTDFPSPVAEAGKVIVHIKAAALNHRDLYITQGLYPGIRTPNVLGSDGAGVCEGAEVLIDPSFDWGEQKTAQGRDFHILGMPTAGTFAAEVAVPRANIHPKPAHLSWEQAAAIPLAGVTAWRVLCTRCRLQAGEKVLITGIGGGVALFVLQFAVAAGAQVWVSSGSTEKIAKAVALGAQGGVSYREPDWDKQLRQQAGGFDVIIDSAGGDGFALLPGLCNPGARIGVYGGSLGKVNGLSPQMLFWKQISILGSTMGTAEDFGNMLAFVNQHQIIPVVDQVFTLSAGNEAFERMQQGSQFGKIVLRVDPPF